jgi:putative membrane protein
MLVAILAMLISAQAPTVGPALSPRPHDPVVARTADGTVLGALGAIDANAIEVAKLATTKASNGDAKAYAAILLRAHQLSLTSGTQLAKRLGITRLLPADSAMARAQVDRMASLNALSGAAFDQAFVEYAVESHKAAIVKINGTLLAEATRPQVKTYARQRVPILTGHQLAGEKWLAAHPSKP